MFIFTEDSSCECHVMHLKRTIFLVILSCISGGYAVCQRISAPVQKAMIQFQEFQDARADRQAFALAEQRMFSAPDSLGYTDSLLYVSERYLERSMPDKAIPLLMKALDVADEHAEACPQCVIDLSEAYRQKQEYAKGVELLMGLLSDDSPISPEDRAYAYNRLAALYNEWGFPKESFTDSVVSYSEKCTDLSEKIGSKPNLAASQNELSFQYIRKREYGKARELALESVRNFKEAGMPFHAMNALNNLSRIYSREMQYESALQTIGQAMEMSQIQQNRNLYMRLYVELARNLSAMNEYRDAYAMLQISYRLQSEFFRDRIDRQINEESAKYDLLIKEQKIKEEKQINKFQRKQLILMIILLCTMFIALMVSLFYYRLRRRGTIRQKLMEAVVETETRERKRIARDLHDGLGPELSAINHYFQAFLDARPEEQEAIRDRLQQVISDAIEEVSRISHNISPHVLEKHGLITALNNFIAPIVRNGELHVRFQPDLPKRFAINKELTIYRCITELFHNTIKHADAKNISLKIHAGEHLLNIIYTDDGKGFDPERSPSHGMGLDNIRHRIESFGGTIFLESAPGKGIKATIELPI